MTASALLYARIVADAFYVSPTSARPIQRRKRPWTRMSLRSKGEPTTFHKCLAVHMLAAERAGVLD